MRPFLLVALALAGCDDTSGIDGGAGVDIGVPPPVDAAVPSPDLPGSPDLGARPGVGSLEISVVDDEDGLSLPARVLITAVAPTPAVRFDVNAMGVVVNGEYGVGVAPGVIGAPEGVLLVSGAGTLKLPAGTYDLFVTHGPEWEAFEARIVVAPTSRLTVDAPLRRTVDTRGWLAADLHIHTNRSFDSRLQLDSCVVSEVAVGVEVLVTTDHNVLSNLQPVVEELGYGALARAIVGDEFNFYEGHGGAYPMPYDPRDPTGGGIKWNLDWEVVRFIRAGMMFDIIHAFPTKPVVTVNHPRLLPDLGYFTNIRWAPPAPQPDAGKFDAIELLSGYMSAPAELAELMRDWFFLLSSGHRVAALGSSDTHRLRDVKAGFPRTLLRMPTEDPARLLDSDLGDSIRAGRAVATNGPFALLEVDGAGIGDVIENRSGKATARATVDAPAWIDVDKVRIYVNGKLAAERAVAPGKRPIFDEKIPLVLPAGDAWVVLQASGTKPLPVGLIGEHQGGKVVPFVVTNPVFIDGEGDGKWRPTLGDPRDADPGPLGPFRDLRPQPLMDPLPPDFDGNDGLDLPHGPAPEDCEPPLWADPATWVNP